MYLFAKRTNLIYGKLKPHGFVIATGLHKLFSKTASHVFECLSHSLGTKPYDVPYAMTIVRILLATWLYKISELS